MLLMSCLFSSEWCFPLFVEAIPVTLLLLSLLKLFTISNFDNAESCIRTIAENSSSDINVSSRDDEIIVDSCEYALDTM